MNIRERVRAKNVDLLVNSYNNEVQKLNREGFINKESREVKQLRDRYDNLVARFDTDKNTSKKTEGYEYDITLDSERIQGIRGIKPTIGIRSKG